MQFVQYEKFVRNILLKIKIAGILWTTHVNFPYWRKKIKVQIYCLWMEADGSVDNSIA